MQNRDCTDETEAGIGVRQGPKRLRRVASGEDQPAEDLDGLKALLEVIGGTKGAAGLKG